MWLPQSEDEIVNAVSSGNLEETTIFDGKLELPTNNKEIAKDIAAMANDGGVIIYGIGEDENKRLTQLHPIPLAGQAERIDAIVRSSISEPPSIQIKSIPTQANPAIGYILIFIPPSERAPHMVIVKGENRFYGRSATGNAPLNEGDVARLYDRRKKIEIDREHLLAEEISSAPLEPNENFSYFFMFTRPVFSKEGFLNSIINSEKELQEMLNGLINQSCSGSVFRKNVFRPDFATPYKWRLYADGLMGYMDDGLEYEEKKPSRTLNLKIDFNGTSHLFCGRVGQKYEGQKQVNIYPETIAGLASRYLYFISSLYECAHYLGMVDLGIAITGVKGSIVYDQNSRIRDILSPYDQSIYKKTGRFSNMEIKENFQEVSKFFTMPFIKAISQNHINPYQ